MLSLSVTLIVNSTQTIINQIRVNRYRNMCYVLKIKQSTFDDENQKLT